MPLNTGSRLGPYEILAPIGAGGMGEVYRARDPRLDREVAIKVLPAEFSRDAERRRRFEQEARAVSALNHSNILTIHEFGSEGGTAFLVSELLSGESLRQTLQRGPLPVKRAVEIAVDVARGLAAAHERGVVHRDLKPENLFLTRDGSAKILDFGLARRYPERSGANVAEVSTVLETEAGTMLGTVGYMAPEQVRGERVDARADLFALGCVLYEMLGGRRAFDGPTAIESLNAILHDEPAPLAVPPGLDRIVRHCLEKDPGRRAHSAHDLAFGLQSLAQNGESAASSGARKRAARGWGVVAAAAALLVAAGLAALGYRALWLDALPEAPTLRYITFSSRDRQPAVSPDGRSIAFVSERDGVSRIWLKRLDSGDETALTDGPDTLPRFFPDGSAILFTRTGDQGSAIFRVGVLGGEPRRLVQDGRAADVSPDGRRLVFVRARSRLLLADLEGGERELASPDGVVLERPLWSPDGRQVAVIENGLSVATSGKLVVFAADSGARRELAGAPYSLPPALAWFGSDLVYARPEAQPLRAGTTRLFLVDGRDGESRSLLSTPDTIESLDIAAAGTLVLDVASLRSNLHEIVVAPGTVNTGTRTLSVGAAAGTESVRWLTRGSSSDGSPIYTPDGEWIVFASDRGGNLDLWAVATRSGAVRRLTDHPAEDWDPALTRDGKHLLWSSNRSGNFEIWIADADGSGARQLTRDGANAENPSVSPDGEWVVWGSANPRNAGVWKSRIDGSSTTLLAAARSGYVLPEISPDGRFVALVASAGPGNQTTVECVRFEDGARVGAGLEVSGARVRWMPDGKALAIFTRDARGTPTLSRLTFDPVAGLSADRSSLRTSIPSAALRVFALSPDGTRATFGIQERENHLLLVEQSGVVVDGPVTR